MLKIALPLVTTAACLGGFVAQASTIDFTDSTAWAPGIESSTVDGVFVRLSSVGGPITQSVGEAPSGAGSLMGASDGLGIGDDEISVGGQSITVTFGSLVRITALHFLDMFLGGSDEDLETANAQFSDGSLVITRALSATGDGFVSKGDFSPISATSVTFTAGPGNDGAGIADFALAGLDFEKIPTNVEIVPLPGSLALMAAGLVFMGGIGRRQRRHV